jgi:hypothetical protein
MIFLDGGPTNHKSLLEEHPPEPVSASREDKCVTLTALYKLAILLSNKCHNVGRLIRPDQVPDLGYADEEDSHGRSDQRLMSRITPCNV